MIPLNHTYHKFMFIPPISAAKLPSSSTGADLTILLADDRAVSALIEKLLDRANLSEKELAERLGVRPQTVHQYRMSLRKRPSIQWLVKLASACGAKIVIEFPPKPIQE